MIEQLREQIKVVAEARRDTRNAKDAVSVARIEWEVENRSIIMIAETFYEELLIDEIKLRELTLEVYNETGNKTPAEGVGIRERTVLTYNDNEALNWGIDHNGIALKLDKRAFENVVKATPAIVDFVTITKEPQATIATNLDKSCENNTTREEKK